MRDERRRSNDSRRDASDYQAVSDAVETTKEGGPEHEREIQRDRGRVCASELGCKDDRHEKRIRGGARGEVNQEGQWMYSPKCDMS